MASLYTKTAYCGYIFVPGQCSSRIHSNLFMHLRTGQAKLQLTSKIRRALGMMPQAAKPPAAFKKGWQRS